jgi:hypothetical protein
MDEAFETKQECDSVKAIRTRNWQALDSEYPDTLVITATYTCWPASSDPRPR